MRIVWLCVVFAIYSIARQAIAAKSNVIYSSDEAVCDAILFAFGAAVYGALA